MQLPAPELADLANGCIDCDAHLGRQSNWRMLELPAAALLKQRVGFVLAGVEVVLAIAPATGVAMEPGAVGGPGDEVVTGLVHDFDDCGACGTSMLLMPPAYAG